MSIDGDMLSSFAGPAGIGAMCVLAAFLFFDGRAPALFPTFNTYAESASWSIVAAVPVLALSYVLGLSVMIGSEHLVVTVAHQRDPDQTSLSRMVAADYDKDSLSPHLYVDARRNRALLAGGAMALVLLGIGALSEISNLRHLRAVIVGAVCGILVLAVLAAALAVREGERANAVAASSRLAKNAD